MATYVTLVNWTEQGVKNYKDTADRVDAANEVFAELGGRITDIYWTLGPYDIVTLSEFPDDESATAAALKLGAQGNVRTTTMRAFGRDEIKGIIDR
ncbi:MAG TPA: GYD domain-containing protein [Actinomycetota bacterium]